VGQIYQDIFEKLWVESKRNNQSLTSIASAFSESDP